MPLKRQFLKHKRSILATGLRARKRVEVNLIDVSQALGERVSVDLVSETGAITNLELDGRDAAELAVNILANCQSSAISHKGVREAIQLLLTFHEEEQ